MCRSRDVLGRLAIDRSQQGRGARPRVLRPLCPAISDQARAFDQAFSFDPSPKEPMTLMATLADIRSLEADSGHVAAYPA